MNDNINITEEDIFLYIRYPDSLSEDKKKYITDNPDQFQNAIEHYRLSTTQLGQTEIDELNNKIENRIIKNNTEAIVLTPTWVSQNNQSDGLRLAAASVKLEKKTDSISFSDSEHKFVIRIVQSEKSKLLYILPNIQIKPDSKFKVLVNPSKNNYTITDISQPINIELESTIESIELTSSVTF